MRIHDIADRFVRNRLLGRSHHVHSALVVRAALDHQDVFAHVHGQRQVVATDGEGTVADLLVRWRGGRSPPPPSPPLPPAGRTGARRTAAPPSTTSAAPTPR